MAETVQILGESSTVTTTGDSGKFLLEVIKVISNALKVADYAQKAGENPGFWTTDVCVPVEKCIDRTADGLQVTGPCRITGYVVKVATATAGIDVEDSTDGAGSILFTIPASTAVGVYNFGGLGIICDTGAYLDYQASATGTVALLVQADSGSTIAAS